MPSRAGSICNQCPRHCNCLGPSDVLQCAARRRSLIHLKEGLGSASLGFLLKGVPFMAYRKILVQLVGATRDTTVLRHGFELAATFASHVSALLVRPNPAEVIPYLGAGISARVVQEVIAASREAAK